MVSPRVLFTLQLFTAQIDARQAMDVSHDGFPALIHTFKTTSNASPLHDASSFC
jgi:hypothetical protein